MKETLSRLKHLKEALYQVTQDAKHGRVTSAEAADRIIDLRDEIDALILHVEKLKSSSEKERS